MHEHYIMRTWVRGRRGVRTPQRQHVIHHPDSACVKGDRVEVISGVIVRHLRFEEGVIWACGNCLPHGI